MPVDIDLLLTAGKALAAAMLILVLLAIVNVWRRGSFPDVTYGGVTLSRSRLRFVWFGILIGGMVTGAARDPVANRINTVEESVSIPWELFSALLAYVLLVVRWNPENRWALRILRGRRRLWDRVRRRTRRQPASTAGRTGSAGTR